MAYGLTPVGPPTRRPAPVRAAPSALGLPSYGGPTAAPVPRPEATPLDRSGAFFGGGFSARGSSRDLLQQGIKSGALTPQYLQRLARRRAYANYLNTRRRGANAASLYAYGDPYAARSAAINSDIEASRGLGQELTNADIQSYGSYRDLIASLLGNERNAEEAAAQRKAEERAAAAGNLGQLGGAAIGAILPGVTSRILGGKK